MAASAGGYGSQRLAAVLDLCSRRIVGWAMAPAMPATPVCDALRMAITLRSPAPGLMVHSDRGSQYASADHRKLLAKHQIVACMSRKGNCWDAQRSSNARLRRTAGHRRHVEKKIQQILKRCIVTEL